MDQLVQLLRLTKTNGQELWINPHQIIYAEVGKRDQSKEPAAKDSKTPKKEEFITILHVTGKDGKVFVTQSPAEINKIIRSIKRNVKIEYQNG